VKKDLQNESLVLLLHYQLTQGILIMVNVYHLNALGAVGSRFSFQLADQELVKKNWQDGRYTHVAVVATDDLDQAYELTNNIDKRWTDNVGVAPVDGHGKRSTDVGDVLELNGKFFVCASIGWDEIVF
jgi:hypothetical protein